MILPPVSQIIFYALPVMVLLELLLHCLQVFRLCIGQYLVHLVELIGLVPVLPVTEVVQRFLNGFRICRLLGSLVWSLVWSFVWSLVWRFVLSFVWTFVWRLLRSRGSCPLHFL